MKSLAAGLSTIIQLIYVLALLEAITVTVKTIQIVSLHGGGDPKAMAGAVSQNIINLGFGTLIGLAGVFIAWRVLRNRDDRPGWFLPVSTFFAWAWMVFVPVGTVIGVLMLRWRRSKPDADLGELG